MNAWDDSTAWNCDTLTLGINSHFLYDAYAFGPLGPAPFIIENMEAAHA